MREDCVSLRGRVGLVTGGASGAGLATAMGLVAKGAEIYITGQRQEELDEAARSCGKVICLRGSAADLADLDRFLAIIREERGGVDFVVAHAGSGELLPLPEFMPQEQVTEIHFEKCFGMRVKGTFFTVQKALPLMGAGGSIVIDGSLVSLRGLPAFGLYAATKAALHSFARTWSAELKGRNIRVNMVTGGALPPHGLTDLGEGREQIEKYQAELATTPHAGVLDRTAQAVMFLVSEESDRVSGMEFFVDGGAIPI